MTEFEKLKDLLEKLSDENHYLFALEDLAGAFPEKDNSALKNLLSRSVKKGILVRVCRGIYLNPRVSFSPGLVLYHTAGRLRASFFNYLSLETVLSELGIISQLQISWISLMTSGRSYTFDCGKWGSIEFIHTKKKPETLIPHLSYDQTVGLWRASAELALRDLRDAGRPLDLINWEVWESLR